MYVAQASSQQKHFVCVFIYFECDANRTRFLQACNLKTSDLRNYALQDTNRIGGSFKPSRDMIHLKSLQLGAIKRPPPLPTHETYTLCTAYAQQKKKQHVKGATRRVNEEDDDDAMCSGKCDLSAFTAYHLCAGAEGRGEFIISECESIQQPPPYKDASHNACVRREHVSCETIAKMSNFGSNESAWYSLLRN